MTVHRPKQHSGHKTTARHTARSRHASESSSRQRRLDARAAIRRSRPIHKRVLLHPATMMTLLVMGVLIVGWTYHAIAASYSVTAKVPAPPLSEGAAITSPVNGAVLSASPITVAGTCPDTSYVKLTRNGDFGGVAFCAADHTFTITTSLSPGLNALKAQDYNTTDDAGPDSSQITVSYNPPSPLPATVPASIPSQPSSSSPTTPHTEAVSPLQATSDYHYQAFITHSLFHWEITVDGGKSPYAEQIHWGDSQTTAQTQAAAGNTTIAHYYDKPGYYAIIVAISDQHGSNFIIQLAALIRAPGTSGYLAAAGSTPLSWVQSLVATVGDTSHWLWIAWPTYMTVVLMAASFWLGEQQILRQAIIRHKAVRPAHH